MILKTEDHSQISVRRQRSMYVNRVSSFNVYTRSISTVLILNLAHLCVKTYFRVQEVRKFMKNDKVENLSEKNVNKLKSHPTN